MLVMEEEYELLVQFMDWFREQELDYLALMNSKEIVEEFLED
jgi:hypothetical protein